MADKVAGLLFRISADTKALQQGFRKAQTATQKMKSSMSTLQGAIVAAFGAIAIRAIKNFVQSSLSAYDVQAKAEASLLTALKGREAAQKRLLDQSAQLQKITLFGDEETIAAQALLASLGLTEAQILRITPAIQDMATGLRMDLVGAASLAGKSITTTTDALARYFNTGLKGVSDQSERTAVLTQALTEKFEGQAKAAAKAGTGGLKQLSNALGDIKERLGELAMPKVSAGLEKVMDLLDRATLDPVKEGLNDASKALNEFKESIAGLSKEDAAAKTVKDIQLFERVVVNLSSKFNELDKSAMGAWKNFWNPEKALEQKTELASLESLIAKYTQLIKDYRVLLDSIWAGTAVAGGGPPAPTAPSTTGIQNAQTGAFAITPGLGDIGTGKIFDFPGGFSGTIEEFSLFMEMWRDAPPLIAEGVEKIKGPIMDLSMVMQQTFMDATDAFSQGIQNLFAGTANLEGGFSRIMGAFGKFMVKMGSLFIAWAIAQEAFAVSLKTMFTGIGAPAVFAAGVALVAIGSAISGLAARAGSSGGGGGGLGGYSASTSFGGNFSNAPGITRLDGRYLAVATERGNAFRAGIT